MKRETVSENSRDDGGTSRRVNFELRIKYFGSTVFSEPGPCDKSIEERMIDI